MIDIDFPLCRSDHDSYSRPRLITNFSASLEDMSRFLSTITLVQIGVGVVTLLVAIMVPLNGVVTRLRAQYNPKCLQFDPRCDMQPHIGPVITSFFAMLVRVRRIEGWSGLYKGLVPTLLDASVSIPMILLLRLMINGVLDWKFIFYGIGGVLLLGVSSLVRFTPLVVLINRAIITRHKLPYSSALGSLQVLLTPTERQCPWILRPTSSAWQVVLLQISHFNLVTIIWHRFLRIPQLELGQLSSEGFLRELTIFLAFTLADTLVLTPLQVITLRLTLQRVDAPPESINSSEEGDLAEVMGDFRTGENVISLRVDSDAEPYTGPIDCVKKIINEEGWGALYRAWWWTAFTLLLGGMIGTVKV